MKTRTALRLTAATMIVAGVAGCGMFGGGAERAQNQPRQTQERESTIWDLFGSRENPNTAIGVNKYIWNASLEVLNFLPVQSIDPFTGVIVTGYGTPPGGGRAYRATIKVSDPALDARSLKLALEGPGGATVAPETVRAVENAILTRARQLRVQDGKY